MDDDMNRQFAFRLLTLRDIPPIARWRYPPPYDFYDIALWPVLSVWALQHLPRSLRTFACYTVWTERDGLVGLFTYIHDRETVVLGVAMRPDLTGKRLGPAFVHAGMRFAKALYTPRHFALDVATFNVRARRVYERLGFAPARLITRRTERGEVEFLEMTREA